MGHEGLAASRDCDGRRRLYRSVIIATAPWSSAVACASRELALDYFAKRERRRVTDGRCRRIIVMPIRRHLERADADRLATLPACGIAWGIKLDQKPNVVVTTIGDAATRQGDFFEAVCFAKERKLPVLFVVEDNKYGISSPTRKINPLRARCSSA